MAASFGIARNSASSSGTSIIDASSTITTSHSSGFSSLRWNRLLSGFISSSR
jgi:hypothetical protein